MTDILAQAEDSSIVHSRRLLSPDGATLYFGRASIRRIAVEAHKVAGIPAGVVVMAAMAESGELLRYPPTGFNRRPADDHDRIR